MDFGSPYTGTTTGVLTPGGIAIIGTTTGSLVYTLPTPVPGGRIKLLTTVVATTTGLTTLVDSGSTGITFDGTNDRMQIEHTGTAVGVQVELIAQTATRWRVNSAFPSSTYISFV